MSAVLAVRRAPVLDRLTLDPEEHIYRLDDRRVRSVTQVLSPFLTFDLVRADVLEFALKRGSAVHLAAQYDDEGLLDEGSVGPFITPYLGAYRRFRRESGFEPEFIEQMVYSERYDFAGMLDRIGRLNARRILLDIKSGDPEGWHALQLAGYELGAEECLGLPGLPRFGLYLRRDGSYRLLPYTSPLDKHYFISAVQTAKAKEIYGTA